MKGGLDLSKFRKIKSDANTSTFQHKDGHTITIAHKKLSGSLKSQLDKLPVAKGVQKFADGGVADSDSTQDSPDQIAQDASTQTTQDSSAPPQEQSGWDYFKSRIGDAAGALGIGTGETPAMASESVPNAPSNPESTPSGPATMPAPSNPDPFGTMGALNQQMQGVQEVGKGQQLEAQAQGAQGAANVAQEQSYQQQIQKNLADYQAASAPIIKERQAIMADIQSGHIDPKRYIDNMSTGGKIATGIGLVLGGMGAGLTHGPNLAFQYLQGQIDKDLDAQKLDLGKKQNLLTYNMQQGMDLRDAYNMAKIQNNDILSSHLRMEADKTQDPIAKARLLQIDGQTQQASAQLQHQMALARMQSSALGGQGQGGMNPVMAIKMLAPAAEQPALMKDLQTKQNMDSANKDLMDAFDYNSKNNTILGKANPQNQSRLEALIDSKLIGLAHASAGRFNMEEIPFMKTQFSKPTDDQQTVAVKRQNFQKGLQEKANFPSLAPYGVRSGSPQQSQSSGNFGFKPRSN